MCEWECVRVEMCEIASSWREYQATGRGRRRGFTLLEVIIALGLMVAMMGGVYEFYLTTMHARQASVDSMREVLLMRTLLEQIADEIRQATNIVPGDGTGFIGTDEQLTIVRTRLPDRSSYDTFNNAFQGTASPGRQEITRVSYYRERDTQVQDEDGTDMCRGLVREQSRILNPSSGGMIVNDKPQDTQNELGLDIEAPIAPQVDRELIASEIRYLKFEYLDGKSWHKSWQPAEEDATEGDAGDGEAGKGEAGKGEGGKGEAGKGEGGDGGGSAKPALPAKVALPQAVRITIGRVKRPWKDDVSLSEETEDEERRTYHPDRWVLEVYLRQADQTLLSSRQYGRGLGDEESETVEQTGGGVK